MDTMLQIENMTVELGGRTLIRNLDMRLAPGEMVCLTGESGCGKTTLLRSLLGFVPLAGGRVTVAGHLLSPSSAGQIRTCVDYVPQELSVPCERVGELLRMVFGMKANRHLAYSEERLFAAWKELGLEPELYRHRLAKVSGGQRQRIMLSVAALTGKPLLLADEPTAALDEENARRTGLWLRRLCGQGRAALVVSHDEHLAAACDRIVRL